MTATDELRRLLDERGVEWWQSANTLGCVFTRWYSTLFGDEVCAMENGEEGLVLFDHFVTPEQAVEATLGRRTTTRHGKWRTKYGRSVPCCECCGYGIGDERWHYCPSCGAEVVDG